VTLAGDLVERGRAHAHREGRRAGAQPRAGVHHAIKRSRDIRQAAAAPILRLVPIPTLA
jgi:hypothetical protein